MEELRFVVFGEDALIDYMDVVLPNVWDELLTLQSFEEAGVIALAGEIGGETVGAAVARVQLSGEVQVYSLYVAPEHRRKKVGTALLDGVLELARRRLLDPEEPETLVSEIIDYTMPPEESRDFEAFLRSVGFRSFDALPSLYLLSSGSLPAPLPGDAVLVSELPEDEREAVNDLLLGSGIPTMPELCAVAGEGPACMGFAVPDEGGDYIITSYGEGADAGTYRQLLDRLFAAVAERQPEFTVLADGTRNLLPEVWQELGALAVPRCIARRSMIFAD